MVMIEISNLLNNNFYISCIKIFHDFSIKKHIKNIKQKIYI